MTEDELARHVFDFMCVWTDSEDYITGFTFFNEEERRRRICESCEWFRKNTVPEKDRTCKICGCLVDSKVSEPLEKCPENKWEPHFESFKKTTYADFQRKRKR